MKIGVTSDTHSFPLPKQMLEEFKKVDLIVHAGDFCSLQDVNMFKKLGDLRAVCGNADESAVSSLLPSQLVFDCEGIRIGVYHGRGSRTAILKTVMAQFGKSKPQIVIFGHSHLPVNETIDGTLYFNPGSPNDEISTPFRSYGIIEVKGAKIDAKIVKVK
jgi:putative phosphoesterase